MQEKLDAIHEDVKEIRTDLREYSNRLTKVETDMNWLKGHMNLTVGAILAILTGVVTYWLTGSK